MDKKRPGGLTAVMLVGIVLGSLGTCGGLSSIVSLAMQDQMQAFSRQMAEVSSQGNQTLLDQQLVLQERVNELSEEWKPALYSHQIVNLLASLVLLAGGILLLKWKPNGPEIFTAGAVVSILADGGGGVIQVLYQLEIGTVLQEYMSGLTSDPALAGAERSMSAIGTASTRAGMFFGVAWVALKLGFYGYGIMLLRKPAIRALFAKE
jgi:hypothetical protein